MLTSHYIYLKFSVWRNFCVVLSVSYHNIVSWHKSLCILTTHAVGLGVNTINGVHLSCGVLKWLVCAIAAMLPSMGLNFA